MTKKQQSKKQFHRRASKGVGVIELVVAISIGMVFMVGIIQVMLFAVKIQERNYDKITALHMASESIEIIRSLRTVQGWDVLATPVPGGQYHIEKIPIWSLVPNCNIQGKFTLCIVPTQMYRDDTTGDPFDDPDVGRTLDSDTLKYTVTINWISDDDILQETKIEYYFTNWE